MADQLLFRGGSTSNVNDAGTLVHDREIVIDTTTNQVVLGSAKDRTVMENTSGNVSIPGNLGVGTTSPQTKLEIDNGNPSGSLPALGGLLVTNAGTADNIAAMCVATGSGPVFNVMNNGSVGIGTPAPQSLLHARVDGNDIKGLMFLQNRNGGANAGLQISLSNALNDQSENRLAYFRALNTGLNNNGNHLTFGTNPNGLPPEERVRITSNGLVGIGVSSPASLLHLSASSPMLTFTDTDTGVDHRINCDSSVGSFILDADFNDENSNSSFLFKISQVDRFKINNFGRLSTYSEDGTAFIHASSKAAGTTNRLFEGRYSATGLNGGTKSIEIFTNGDVKNTNDVYAAISDVKLKENIVDANSQWDDFKAVRFRKYNFKEETGNETFTQLGVIAQELETVCPGLVTESPDLDEEGNDLGTTTKGVKYSILTKKALVALQEAMTRIETLEASNADLLARVSALEAN